jgi:hypothetical protein
MGAFIGSLESAINSLAPLWLRARFSLQEIVLQDFAANAAIELADGLDGTAPSCTR